MTRFYLITLAVIIAAPLPASAAPQTDVTARMASRLTEADTNHDGVVTRAEALAFRNSQFDRLDRNHDGVLDDNDAPRLKRAAAQVEQMRKAFDSNGDGRISRDELTSGPMPAFDQADRDGNGVIDGHELKTLKDR